MAKDNIEKKIMISNRLIEVSKKRLGSLGPDDYWKRDKIERLIKKEVLIIEDLKIQNPEYFI